MKKFPALLFLALAVIAFFGIWKYQERKADNATVTFVYRKSDAPKTVPQQDPCLELGMPEGSYVFVGGVCSVKEEYMEKTSLLSEQERNEGDKIENVFIQDVFEKDNKIYISTDHIDFPECNQLTEGSVKKANLPDCNPNGFYLDNSSPELTTYELGDSVKIRLMQTFGSSYDLNTLTPKEFMNGRSQFGKYYVYDGESYSEPSYVPFLLIFKNGKIIYIHQIYLP